MPKNTKYWCSESSWWQTLSPNKEQGRRGWMQEWPQSEVAQLSLELGMWSSLCSGFFEATESLRLEKAFKFKSSCISQCPVQAMLPKETTHSRFSSSSPAEHGWCSCGTSRRCLEIPNWGKNMLWRRHLSTGSKGQRAGSSASNWVSFGARFPSLSRCFSRAPRSLPDPSLLAVLPGDMSGSTHAEQMFQQASF